MVPFERLGTVFYSHSIVTVAAYHVSFRRYSEILVENRDIFISFCIRPLVRGPRRNIVIPFASLWKNKLEWRGYPTVKNSLWIRLSVSTEYRRVTDRQTNGRTNKHLATA